MSRVGLAAILILAGVAPLTPSALAAPPPCPGAALAIAGKLDLACADTDRNGILDSADCCLRGFFDVPDPSDPLVGDLCLIAQQGSSPTKVLGCQSDEYMGPGNLDPVEGAGRATLDTPFTMAPVAIDVNVTGATPVSANAASVFRFDIMAGIGEGQLVTDGPAAALDVVLPNLTTVRFGFARRNQAGQDYQCARIPFRTINGMPLELFDLCLPVVDGVSVVAYADDPSQRLLRISFRTAAGARGVPTLTEVGLLAAAVVLLAAGALSMRRSRRFATALPQV